jgi:hypothetical protein
LWTGLGTCAVVGVPYNVNACDVGRVDVLLLSPNLSGPDVINEIEMKTNWIEPSIFDVKRFVHELKECNI